MRTLFAAAVIVLAAASGSYAQQQPEKALQDAQAARAEALRTGDGAAWAKYTTDDFMVIGTDGGVKSKADRMTEINASKSSSPAAASAPSDTKWRMYGPSTAIETAQITIDGKPTMVTDVWVKQQGMWKVATVQLTNISK